ncbi:MAG: signal peptidase I [candidate division WOR-3 bacterium]
MNFFKKNKKEKKVKTKEEKIIDWIDAILFAVVATFLLKSFFIQSYMVFSGSMLNTLQINDFLFVNRLKYSTNVPITSEEIIRYRNPKRGDIVVFKFPYDGRPFVKRCVGLPGDTIEIKNKILYINGKTYDEPFVQHIDSVVYPHINDFYKGYLSHKEYQRLWENGEFYMNRYFSILPRDNFGPVVVPPDHYFMLGDNRDNSDDSRFWGPLHRKYIVGTPFLYYFSIDKTQPVWKIWKFIRFNRILRPVKFQTFEYK